MKKIILVAAAVVALSLTACGEEKQEAAPAPQASATPAAEVLSAADKAAVDALKGNVEALQAEMQKHVGTPRGAYALEKLKDARNAKKEE